MTSLRNIFSAFLALGLLVAGSSSAFSQSEPDRKAMIERHEQMAKAHQDMAKCLKSKKSLDECRAKMKENCPMMQGGSCPMMGEGGCCAGMGGGAGGGPGPGPHGKCM